MYGTLTGVEAEYNSALTYHGQPIRSFDDLITSNAGTDTVQLTLDSRLQLLAQQQLNGLDGAVVLLDPSSGAILAMYSNPTFDPNTLASQSAKVEQNYWTNVYLSRDSRSTCTARRSRSSRRSHPDRHSRW